MNLHCVERKPLFEFTHRGCRDRVRDDRKQGRLQNEMRDLTVILSFIGGDSDGSIRGQGTMERGEKVFGHQTAGRVAAFRPRIGKHKVKRRDGILREQPLDRVGNLEPQDARILQPAAFDFPASTAHSTNQTLDAEKILAGIFAGKGREKRAITAAEIDFDGRVPAIDFFEIERRDTIGRDEFHLTCYGCGRIGGQHVK
jgi:hypothetical protein